MFGCKEEDEGPKACTKLFEDHAMFLFLNDPFPRLQAGKKGTKSGMSLAGLLCLSQVGEGILKMKINATSWWL